MEACGLAVTVIGADRCADRWLSLTCPHSGLIGHTYLSWRCRWRCHLWPEAAFAGTRSPHLWRPGAAAAPTFLPVGEDKEDNFVF